MLVLSLLVGIASATMSLRARGNKASLESRQAASTGYLAHTIDMPIDHFPHSAKYEPHVNGTFKQRYFFDASYYKAGGPVYLYIGGETSGESRFSNLQTGIIQILMQATNGLGVILENRYYGESYPFANSSTDNLRYLTNEQTIADNAYFAQHATFPGLNATITAPQTPWILYGGSLAGGETAFSIKAHGDILYAGIAASAPSHAVLGYPEWYAPIQKYAPSDCVSSINGIIEKIDALVATGNAAAITQLKTIFGLQDLVDIRDFAMTIAFPLGGPFNYPTDTWQELLWDPKRSGSSFFNFCSNVTSIDPPTSVRAVDYVLSNYTGGQPWTNLGNYANYFKNNLLPLCPSGDVNSVECFGTQDAPYWADISNSGGRSYLYTTCTELGAYQVAPSSYPSLIMNVLQANYTQQWCNWAFPAGKFSSIPPTPDLSQFNKFGGSNISADRLAFIDGDVDPWLDLCYHSNFAPARESSDLHPSYLIAGSGHHWDSYGILNIGAEPLFIQQAHLWEIRTVKKWLKDFPKWKPGKAHH